MKQQQITYDKGITYVPSDALCSDNALSECMGMTYENGEMKPIQNNEAIHTVPNGSTLLFVHRLPGIKNLIYSSSGYLYVDSYNSSGRVTGFPKQIGSITGTENGMEAVGKTLILSTNVSLFYFLWKGDNYTPLGSKIPEPDIRFMLTAAKGSAVAHADIPNDVFSNLGNRTIATGKTDDYTNLIVGLYSKCKNIASEQKGFYAPFMVRYAVELYDGTSLTLQSNPILLFPAVTANLECYPVDSREILYMKLYLSQLMYYCEVDYSDWRDIVKNISIFVSRQKDIYDTTEEYLNGAFGTQSEASVKTLTAGSLLCERIIASNPTEETRGGSYGGVRDYAEYEVMETGITDTYVDRINVPEGSTRWDVLKKKNILDVLDEVKEDGVFYKLCDIGLESTGAYTYRNLSTVFKKEVLKTIETQEQMVTQYRGDDYYSHCTRTASFVYTYNQRLHIANIDRGIFPGFKHFSSNGAGAMSTYEVYVRIKTDDGERVAYINLGYNYEKIGNYFFYPDPRAYEAVIVKNGNSYATLQLTEHPALNGSYFIMSPLVDIQYTGTEPSGLVPNMEPEHLHNILAVSEVNNPFVFYAEGYYTVGKGDVVGMATQTTALSEGQFGQFPLIVFATDGLWTMPVANTGYYLSTRPLQREVCSVPKSITETDGAVYFVSKKGLMVIVGNNVKCVSEQLDGKVFSNSTLPQITDGDFKGFLNGCFIAYDYRDSQLLIINPSKTFHWVYNMKSGTFAKMSQNNNYIKTVVNDYPDNLIQETGGDVYSLLNKPDENEDQSSYSGMILTRPMKLENGLSLKTIMDLKNVFTMEGTITLFIYGSNNCKNWMEVNSLTGVPWKYYRFKIVFSNMKATDRFSGTVLVTQERRTNKLR